jgi:hypothetical protein
VAPGAAGRLPLATGTLLPTVRLDLNGGPAQLVVDPGATSTTLRADLRRLRQTARPAEPERVDTVLSAGVPELVSRHPELLRLGGVVVDGEVQRARRSDSQRRAPRPVVQPANSLLGMDVLGLFNVVLDRPGGTLLLLRRHHAFDRTQIERRLERWGSELPGCVREGQPAPLTECIHAGPLQAGPDGALELPIRVEMALPRALQLVLRVAPPASRPPSAPAAGLLVVLPAATGPSTHRLTVSAEPLPGLPLTSGARVDLRDLIPHTAGCPAPPCVRWRPTR